MKRLFPLSLQWIVSKAGLFSLALALIFTIAALTISEVANRALTESYQHISRAQQLVGELQELRKLLLNIETGQRGYIITGRREYLQPYEQALNGITPTLAALRELTRNDPEQSERLDRLGPLVKQRLSETGDTIAMRELAGFDAARAVVQTDLGKRTMDDVRSLLAEIENAEQIVHARRIGALQRDLATVRFAFLGIALLDAALIGLGFALIWRELEARQREQQSLLQQQAVLERRVDERTAELSELSLHLQSVREQEKSGLAREIHDEIGSTLVAAKIDVAAVRDRLKRSDDALAQRLTRALSALNDVIKVKRRIIEDLRPTLLDSLGIGAALRWQCQQFTARTNCNCRVVLYEEDLRLPEPVSIVIYRVVQEALTNITKYAKASEVRIDISRQGNELILNVADNGVGIDPDKKSKPTSHGLIGMRERVRQAGGTIEITGEPNRGTTITAHLPVPEESFVLLA